MRFLDSLRQLVRTYMARLAKKIDKLSGGIVSPDSITWAGVAGHLPIALFIAFGQLHIAAILMIIFGLFDVLDGEMARYKHIASPRGMVVDASTDRVKEVLVFFGNSLLPFPDRVFFLVVHAALSLRRDHYGQLYKGKRGSGVRNQAQAG